MEEALSLESEILSRNRKSPQGHKITSSNFCRVRFTQGTRHKCQFADRFTGSIQPGFAFTTTSKQS